MNIFKTSFVVRVWVLAVCGIFVASEHTASALTNTVSSGAEDTNNQDDDDSDCDPPTANDGPEGENVCGAPWHRVSSPFINLWVHDTPLRYRLANGQWFELKLSYKHRREWDDRRDAVGGFGEKWHCNWIGFLEANDREHVTNYLAGGGMRVFSTNGTREFRSGRMMIGVADAGGTAYRIATPTLSHNYYSHNHTGPLGRQFKLRTKQADRYGRNTVFEWETSGDWVRLKHVYDRDGRKCSFTYTNTAIPAISLP